MITGINHITLSVRDLNESFAFYQNVLGFKPLMKKGISAYFLAGDLWFCLEEDKAVRAAALPEYTHIAFSVEESDFPTLAKRVRDSGMQIFKENLSEGSSLYFVDPNGHKLEIHVGSWETRLAEYRSLPGQSGTEFFD